MADIKIMKAVEFDKLPAKFRKQYPDLQALQAAGYWLQKKYDGCFGMAVIRVDGNHQMLSRTGEDYTKSCIHILDELYEAAEALHGGTLKQSFVVIGELWLPDVAFPTISGKFRQQRACSYLQFIANDLLPIDLESLHPYRIRFDKLAELLPDLGSVGGVYYCHVAETFGEGEWDGAMYLANAWKDSGGFDGAILRNPAAGYTIGLVKRGEIVKVKPVLSLDLEVRRSHWKTGEKTGRDVLILTVIYQGVLSQVGSGVPHDMTEPKVGTIVEIECMGVTKDGFLREPRFKGIRFDKTKPD